MTEIEEQLAYMYGLERFGVRMGLEEIERLLDALDNPHRKLTSIHVAGTNGKGSTAAFLDSILRQSGSRRVGLYTSPHLHRFHERIRVGGVEISDEGLGTLVARIREVVEANNLHPTFFEFTTALAFLYFAEQNVEIAVVEVGLGGPLDATSVITPLVTVITNIGLDHEDILGSTTREIAEQEVGLIKPGVPIVTAEEDPRILDIIRKAAQENGSLLVAVLEEMQSVCLESTLDHQCVQVSGAWNGELTIPLLGAHQVTNACTALAAVQASGLNISSEDIVKGISSTQWEGRMQVISRDPLIIVDGAHNIDGAEALGAFLNTLPRCDVLVFAAKQGADISGMIEHVIPLFGHIIITKGTYMPEDPTVIARHINRDEVNIQPDVLKAIAKAKAILPKHGTLVVTGSLYMIGSALKELGK